MVIDKGILYHVYRGHADTAPPASRYYILYRQYTRMGYEYTRLDIKLHNLKRPRRVYMERYTFLKEQMRLILLQLNKIENGCNNLVTSEDA